MKNETLFFVADTSVADFYSHEITRRYNDVVVNRYVRFEEYFRKLAHELSEHPFITVNYHFYNSYDLLNDFQLFGIDKKVNIILCQGIDQVRVDFTPLNTSFSNYNPTGGLPVIKQSLRGIDFRFDSNICEKILERALSLHNLKNMYVNEGHLNLNEFLEEFSSNVLKHYEATHGVISLWEKHDENRVIFYKRFPIEAIEHLDLRRNDEPPSREEVNSVYEIEDDRLRRKLLSLGIKHEILIPLHCEHAIGFFFFFSELDKLRQDDLELLKWTGKHFSLVINNTYFFQKMLRRYGSFNSIFDNVEDAILVVDNNRLVVDINEPCEKLTGWTKKEAVGKFCKLLWHSCDFYGTSICDSNRCPMLVPLVEKKRTTRQKVYTLDKAGTRKVVKSDYFITKNSLGNSDYGVAVVRDLTARVELESKLQRFEQLAALGKFTAELAHEIRNPITGISSNAQFVYEEAQLDKKHRDIIKEIIHGVSAIEATVKKYLRLGHPPQPSLSIVHNFNELVRESINILKKKMDKAKIELELSFGKHLPRIRLDHDLIQQVLMNILMNSIEAMENGGRLEIETWLTHKRKAPDERKEKYLAVKFLDTGSGISPEVLEEIFNPFFTTKPTGSGLGLYMAYRILKDHGAVIEVQSKPGEGTETLIYFKINR